MKPFLIGIAGRSGAGKSEIARQLSAWLPGSPPVVSLDSYYYAMDDVPLEERARRNFDHPDSLDWPLIREHAQALANGEQIYEPIYIFATHTRAAATRRIHPAKYIILEGLFTLHDEAVVSRLDAKIFIETPDGVCYERRKERDVVERGRTVPDIERQYTQTVRPMAEQYVMPTSSHADLVLRGDLPLAETVAVVKAFLQPPVMGRAVPVLQVRSVEQTVQFYVETLGFEKRFIHLEGDPYAGVKRDHIELHFSQEGLKEDKSEHPPAKCRIEVSEIEKLHREFSVASVIAAHGALQVKPWGYKEFTAVDNNGFELTFAELSS